MQKGLRERYLLQNQQNPNNIANQPRICGCNTGMNNWILPAAQPISASPSSKNPSNKIKRDKKSVKPHASSEKNNSRVENGKELPFPYKASLQNPGSDKAMNGSSPTPSKNPFNEIKRDENSVRKPSTLPETIGSADSCKLNQKSTNSNIPNDDTNKKSDKSGSESSSMNGSSSTSTKNASNETKHDEHDVRIDQIPAFPETNNSTTQYERPLPFPWQY